MRRIFATKEQLMTYLLGDFLKHRKFPSKLVVAALAAKILHSATLRPKFASQTLSNCTLGSPNKVHTLRMTRRECEHGASNYDLSMQIIYIKSVGATIGRPRVFGKNIRQKLNKNYILFSGRPMVAPTALRGLRTAFFNKKETRQTRSSV